MSFRVPHTRDYTLREILIIRLRYKISPFGRYDNLLMGHDTSKKIDLAQIKGPVLFFTGETDNWLFPVIIIFKIFNFMLDYKK